MNKKHPWENGPTELIEFAMSKLNTKDEFSHRLAFIATDIGIETLFKTYLLLPEGITKTRVAFSERQKFAKGNFYDLLQGIRLVTNKIDTEDLYHIQFYHGIRNHLYHQGNGITVSKEKLEGYVRLSAKVLNTLLGVDLIGFFKGNHPVAHKKNVDPTLDKRIKELAKEFDRVIRELQHFAKLIIEKMEPKLVLPSTISKLEDLSKNIEISNFHDKTESFRQLIRESIQNSEIREWLLDLVVESVDWGSSQAISNTRFLLELLDDPITFYFLLLGTFRYPISDVAKDLTTYDDISFIDSDEYHIVGLYSTAKVILNYYTQRSTSSDNDSSVVKRSDEILPRLEDLKKEMEGSGRKTEGT
jgi:hypothetical protein